MCIYICVCMATKTISISEEAYNLLRNMRDGKESFTETIIKIAKKDPLSKLAGILTKKEADELRSYIKTSREKTGKRLEQVRERMTKE